MKWIVDAYMMCRVVCVLNTRKLDSVLCQNCANHGGGRKRIQREGQTSHPVLLEMIVDVVSGHIRPLCNVRNV